MAIQRHNLPELRITEMVNATECDLCGLGCGKHPLEQRVGDMDRFFCCLGCLNVYLILSESGVLASGEDIRETELFRRSLELGLISNRTPDDKQRSGLPSQATQSHDVQREQAQGEELLLHVGGMWCTACAWLIEHSLRALPGVFQADVSFASDLVKVRYLPQTLPREHILARISSLGYRPREYEEGLKDVDAEGRDLLIRTGLAAFFWINIMSFSLVLYAGYFEQISGSVRRGLPFVLMALATPVVFYCAQPILRLAWRGLLNRVIRMELLLALGILAAYGYSVVQSVRGEIHLYFDTATAIVTLVLAGKLIERGAKHKATHWIAMLHRMMPNKVRILTHGSERFVSINALNPGQIFLTKAGERIPADGLIVEGESHVDESLLTGESIPVKKCPGDIVIAGSISLDGILRVQATNTANESTLSRIIALVEHALSSRCDLERAVDRVSRIFVPCVVLIALMTFGVTWIGGVAHLGAALTRAITVLVIACPCALGIATPLAMTAALGAASRQGILVRDSRVLETLGKIDTIVLDKTGTVTEGKFSLLEVVTCPKDIPESVLIGAGKTRLMNPAISPLPDGPDTKAEVLRLLASLEQYSEHPLGRAVMEFARQEGIMTSDAVSLEIRKGRGICGTVENQSVFAGNRHLMKELAVGADESLEQCACTWEAEGKTVAFVGWDGELQAVAAFGDRVKPEASRLVSELKRRKVEVQLVSGDSYGTTKRTASILGIEACQSQVLPEEKAEAVHRLQDQGKTVAMVGDGINDAPALAQADLGIAMGSGTDIALQAAAVVLMNGTLNRILDVFDLSQKTIRLVHQNLFWAFFYNVIGITLAVAGVLNPIMAAVAMLLSSASVVGNSMRLTRRTDEARYKISETNARSALSPATSYL